MWLKINNKFVNLNTGIYMEKSENNVEELYFIYLKSLHSDRKVILFSNFNEEEIDIIFNNIIENIRAFLCKN